MAKKRKSKRQTLQTKYKIVKRVKEHNKRLKKGSLTIGSKSKKSADNHIPNAWPYKEDLLNEISLAKAKMEELRLRQKDKRKEEIVSFILIRFEDCISIGDLRVVAKAYYFIYSDNLGSAA